MVALWSPKRERAMCLGAEVVLKSRAQRVSLSSVCLPQTRVLGSRTQLAQAGKRATTKSDAIFGPPTTNLLFLRVIAHVACLSSAWLPIWQSCRSLGDRGRTHIRQSSHADVVWSVLVLRRVLWWRVLVHVAVLGVRRVQ